MKFSLASFVAIANALTRVALATPAASPASIAVLESFEVCQGILIRRAELSIVLETYTWWCLHLH